MEKICNECGKKFIVEKHNASRQRFCSRKCRQRNINRKDTRTYQDRKEYMRQYQCRYYYNNSERRRKCAERNKTPRAKEMQKNWVNNNRNKVRDYQIKHNRTQKRKISQQKYRKTEKYKEYQREWVRKNSNKVKEKYKRYYDSDKGRWMASLKLEKRRNKHLFLSGKNYDNRPNLKLKKIVDKRDKVCVYCHDEFDNNNPKKKRSYDHLNSQLPLIKENCVVCCSSCNGSKGEREVVEWCKMKGYIPAPIVYKLLKLQKKLNLTSRQSA